MKIKKKKEVRKEDDDMEREAADSDPASTKKIKI